jgi:hydrogenase nickel incorporation protein HypA/HybF
VHELSIAQSILEIVGQHVPREKQHTVKAVQLLVGELSGVVVDSLTFCFGAITSGSPLERAELAITQVPLEAECRACGQRFRVEELHFSCPGCGGTEIVILAGKELQITAIELFDEIAEGG